LRDGRIAARRAVAYATSKAALVQLSRCAALDHAADGSRINALCLGDTDTPMLDASSGSQDRAAMLARLGADIPKGRVANPVEIAKAALFLASQQSSFVTGIALPVDGGASTG
jgi:meso-butanediol dehydrogenase/(S,S)-butanediol dehydrogenase/diacetyl reductase